MNVLAKQTHICGVDNKPYELVAFEDNGVFKITARAFIGKKSMARLIERKALQSKD